MSEPGAKTPSERAEAKRLELAEALEDLERRMVIDSWERFGLDGYFTVVVHGHSRLYNDGQVASFIEGVVAATEDGPGPITTRIHDTILGR